MANVAAFCERMRYWCEDANLGYDQVDRWNIWPGGEADCSSLVIHALQEAGFDTGSASYTGDLSANLEARGWVRLNPFLGSAKAGDILLNDAQHVAAVVSGSGWNATVAEAWLNESGGIYYGQSGDQTGWETHTRGMYEFYYWDCILRYYGPEEDDMEPVDVWAYKNENVNGDADAYKLLTDAYHQLTRTDTAGHDNPDGHDLFGRVQIIEHDVAEIKKAVSNIEVTGGAVDYDELADAIADRIAERMRE